MSETRLQSLPAATIARLMPISAASISSVLFKLGLRNQHLEGVAAIGPATVKLIGPAFTLRYIPAREDVDVIEIFEAPNHPQRLAVETVPEGFVMVMDCRGDARAAACGSILVHRMQARGAAGLVSDGGLRDAAEIRNFAMPCYVAGPAAPTNIARHHAVDINVPIACGGVAVYPGDIMVGDADGVVVIPSHLLDQVIELAEPMGAYEAFVHVQIEAGRSMRGIYPPNDEGRARYAKYLSSGSSGN